MARTSAVVDWIDGLPSAGRYVFTRQQAEAVSDSSEVAVQHALRRHRQRGRLVSPRRGFYVIVPPEYRATGSPPASWFIDDLMRFLGRRYYVALLSAAAIHGAAHQQPMVFQVIADAAARDMAAGRVRIEMHTRRRVEQAATETKQTETGTMVVSTAETTVYDLARFADAAGYWNNVATVVGELADQLDPGRLVQAAQQRSRPDVQRLGYVLELLGHDHLAQPLASWLGERRTPVVRLRPDRPAGNAAMAPRWHLIPNEHVEPDLRSWRASSSTRNTTTRPSHARSSKRT
jgi:predicted transcriptional regulator of viral defense system